MKVLALLTIGVATLTLPQAALTAPAAERASFPPPGRSVAEVVSPTWSSGRDRDAADESGQLVRLLGVRRGMAVADIGAGSGYHTVRLSPVVGPSGRVYAQDITPAYLDDLRRETARRGLKNVDFVLGRPDDPGLPPNSVDRAILVHMYHEVAQPYALLWRLIEALKPGAKVGVLDLDRRPDRHGTPPALLRCEFEAVGYRQTGFTELKGGIGYLAVFEAPKPAARPHPAQIRACR
ncbi:methyltransferase domain-containing protein [Phenylobacterium sp. LjRoot219]|uniref:methyltransferase domain-containing protein n=1 Tax=Phenylobacterium sp. LjRoot219 TaxID=3342283 RepID=UPI003ECC7B29